ncbi:hypothetical protein NDU88_008051 [Pleurodeles waltl]|uniref:Uncharacterized protein n=1 Tax=Pleurodeles waltl TaxID=8319 RepID=A0AAV7SU48_PLEWA|nr:hypothetical protein NDU88_008051 [Pleurodeles waltl]
MKTRELLPRPAMSDTFLRTEHEDQRAAASPCALSMKTRELLPRSAVSDTFLRTKHEDQRAAAPPCSE